MADNQTQSFLIFADKQGLGEKLARDLTLAGNQVSVVYEKGENQSPLIYHREKQDNLSINQGNTLLADDVLVREKIFYLDVDNRQQYEEIISSALPRHIIYTWSSQENNNLKENNYLQCLPVINLLQTLTNTQKYAKLWLITQRSQQVNNEEKINPDGGGLWGLGKVIALEHPEYWGGMIDIDSDNIPLNLFNYLLNHPQQETMTAIRNNFPYYCRLQRKSLTVNNKKDFSLDSKSSYLITGGLGALGLVSANYLIKQGAKNLILLSRSQPNGETQQKIKQWQQQGINITISQGDVNQLDSLTEIFQHLKNNLPPLKGIIHSAGVLDDGVIASMTEEKLNKVISAKVMGVNNLHQLSLDFDLDFFIMYSSLASMVGSMGQSNYAIANSYLDSFAYYRHSLNLPALTINWGALDIGMAITTQSHLNHMGVNSISAEGAVNLLGKLLQENNPQVGILNIDWQKISQNFPPSPYLQKLIPTSTDEEKQGLIFQRLQTTTDIKARENILIDYLRETIAKILHQDKNEIKAEDSLVDLGMDSLMVMEAINHLKTDLNIMLYPREIYERPQLFALASYLADEFAVSHGEKTAVKPSTQSLIITPEEDKTEEKITFNPTNHQPIVFILSSPRSGSTLLRVMLASHPQLVSPPELHLLPFATMQERQTELASSHLQEGLVRALMELKSITVAQSEDLINQWIEENLTIGEVYEILQSFCQNRILVDKSPTYANSKETLFNAEKTFSQAKYIHLVRHPYAVIESFARMRMDKLLALKDANPYEIAENIWYQSNQNTSKFHQVIDNNKLLTVVYENLVTNPEKELQNICNFLEIDFDKSLLNPYEGERMTGGLYQQSMSVGDPNFNTRNKIDSSLATQWQNIKLPILLNPLTIQLAEKFNYNLPQESQLFEVEESYVKIRDLDICVCTWGNKNNPIMFIIHGILDQGMAWEKVAQKLAQKGYYVIAPDLRGHGKSQHNGMGCAYNLLDFVADLDCLINHFSAENKVNLLGHSFGSMIASIYVNTRAEKIEQLYLVEPILPAESKGEKDLESFTSQLDYLLNIPALPVYDSVATVAQRLQKTSPNLDDDFALKLATRMTKSVENGVTFTYSPLLATRVGVGFNTIPRHQYLQLLARRRAPSTVIYGSQSNFNRPEDLLAQKQVFVKEQICTIEGGHNLHFDNPEGVAELIKLLT
ncbi:MAG: alpha/beta fold hydrolase [Cyanobacterium sp. T60_A2020_053]|nr:alpha/beta fold hydrolase [Cyanobacterium sp. T60_A2020_053]